MSLRSLCTKRSAKHGLQLLQVVPGFDRFFRRRPACKLLIHGCVKRAGLRFEKDRSWFEREQSVPDTFPAIEYQRTGAGIQQNEVLLIRSSVLKKWNKSQRPAKHDQRLCFGWDVVAMRTH